jgi:hypothetical protein
MAKKNRKRFDPMYIFPILIGLTAIAVLVLIIVLSAV